jgi:hypothetical protein
VPTTTKPRTYGLVICKKETRRHCHLSQTGRGKMPGSRRREENSVLFEISLSFQLFGRSVWQHNMSSMTRTSSPLLNFYSFVSGFHATPSMLKGWKMFEINILEEKSRRILGAWPRIKTTQPGTTRQESRENLVACAFIAALLEIEKMSSTSFHMSITNLASFCTKACEALALIGECRLDDLDP